jgi:hypothetical protein
VQSFGWLQFEEVEEAVFRAGFVAVFGVLVGVEAVAVRSDADDFGDVRGRGRTAPP